MQPKSYENLVSKTMERFNVPREQASLFVSGAVDALQAAGPELLARDVTAAILESAGLQMDRLAEAMTEETQLAETQLEAAQAARVAG